MSSNHYDVIVIGVGTMGAAACWYLAKNKHRVVGLEQFDIPHELGSHSGQSRIIRKAYYEHSNYVTLLEAAYKNWSEIEHETGAKLYHKTGVLYFGEPSSALIKGTRDSGRQFNIPLDVLTQQEARKRFPQTRFIEHHQVLFEPDAGFITPEKSIATYAADAIIKGADIRAREKVIRWNYRTGIVEVQTDKNKYTADRVIFTAGAWTKKLIPPLPAELSVTRQIIAWINPVDWRSFSMGNFPCWLLDEGDGQPFYGFPILPAKDFAGPVGLKLAHDKRGDTTDPDHIDRSIRPGEEKPLIDTVGKYFPGAGRNVLAIKVCMYNNSQDTDFIIDFVPGTNSRAVVATGFSGHGFKFASVVGEIVADLAVEGTSDMPLDFLRLERFKKRE